MKKMWMVNLGSALLLAAMLIPPMSRPMRAESEQEKKPEPAPMKLKVGEMAPEFTLKYFDGAKLQDVSLHEFRGKKNVVVAFFVFAFTGG